MAHINKMKQTKKWLDNPRYVRHAAAAADLFCARFSPDVAMSEDSAEAKANEVRAAIKRDVEHEMVQVRNEHPCSLVCTAATVPRRSWLQKYLRRRRCERHEFLPLCLDAPIYSSVCFALECPNPAPTPQQSGNHCFETRHPQGLLLKMVDGVMATYRTNFFMPNRWGLSLRVDPRLLMTEDELKVSVYA